MLRVQNRATLSRISSADFDHTKGFGASLPTSIYAVIASRRALVLR